MEDNINILGIDLGGTNIRVGKVVGNIITKIEKDKTPANGTVIEVLNALFAIIDACFDSDTIHIGVGVPSVVDTENGIVFDVFNIPSWKEVHLKEILEDRYNVPVFVNNDANCFALGEKYYGKGYQYNNIVGLTLGTGFGSGLILNGKLYEGSNCGAGEIGLIQYLDSNYEHYCSGQFFLEQKGIDAETSCKNGYLGDAKAREFYAEYGYHLGQAVKSVLHAYDPEIIILGGSISKAYELFKPSLMAAIQNFEYCNTLKNIRIEVSELENSAIFGAAGLSKNSYLNVKSETDFKFNPVFDN